MNGLRKEHEFAQVKGISTPVMIS